jgi:hypothetical protein
MSLRLVIFKLSATTDGLTSYSSGVFLDENCSSTKLDHAIVNLSLNLFSDENLSVINFRQLWAMEMIKLEETTG